MNPHNYLIALDPPRKNPSRKWRCNYCKVEGLYEELLEIECLYNYLPCPACGGTPECTKYCVAIVGTLGELVKKAQERASQIREEVLSIDKQGSNGN